MLYTHTYVQVSCAIVVYTESKLTDTQLVPYRGVHFPSRSS